MPWGIMLLNGCAVHLHSFATCDIGKFVIPTSAKRAGGEEFVRCAPFFLNQSKSMPEFFDLTASSSKYVRFLIK